MLDLLHDYQHSFVDMAKKYFGEAGEIAAVCMVGFVPTFLVLAVTLFIFSKIVSGKLNKFHWLAITAVSLVLSPYVGLKLTFAG